MSIADHICLIRKTHLDRIFQSKSVDADEEEEKENKE